MLDPEQSTVVTDEEVPSRIRSVIESAEVEVVLVSPYVDNWQRLFDWLPTAVKKGVKVLLSNSMSPLIKDLYKSLPGFRIEKVYAKRSVNSRADRRGKISEALIRNF